MRKPTIIDVAQAAGVSKSLASLVMRDEPGASAATRRRVLEVADRLGYHPDSRARLLRSGSSRLLGVVYDVRQPFQADLVTDLYVAAGRVGHELALSAVTPHRDEAAAIAGLLRDRCAALILLGPGSPAGRLSELAGRIPLVVLARGLRDPAVAVVRTADDDGLGLAVDHLVSLGHRRIAHVDGGRAPGAADRRRGYRAAMRRHGLDVRLVPGGPTEADGAAAARALLADPPTGVAVFNDRCATGVLDVLLRARVEVPGEISVVGYDDSYLARLAHVNLTTIAQDTQAMSAAAVDRALLHISNFSPSPSASADVVVPPRLVVRGTTGPVRSGHGANPR